MRTKHGILVAIFSLIGSGAALAHHSFSTEYDGTKTFNIKGTVSKVEWTNPHAWIHINVKDEATGKVTNWAAEMGPPHGLQRQGWRRDTLKIGEEVTIVGSRARDDSNKMNARQVTLTSTGGRPGETLDAASSGSPSVN